MRIAGDDSLKFCYDGGIMRNEIAKLVSDTLLQMGFPGAEVTVNIPENPSNGEYTTNIALQLRSNSKLWPMDIALQVVNKVKSQNSKVESKQHNHIKTQVCQKLSRESGGKDVLQAVKDIKVAPPGFINFYLTEAEFSRRINEVLKTDRSELADSGTTSRLPFRQVMVEFAHPNTHKAFHIGHLRNITTGEAIVRLLESQGSKVIRVNYQGDIGMHIAKAIYGLLHSQKSKVKSQNLDEIRKRSVYEKVEYLGQAYAAGSNAFEESDDVKAQIGEINKKIYAKDSEIYPLYQETRQWSLDYFAAIYQRVGSHFDRFYFEGEVYETGKNYVLAGLKKGIFVESDGAIIFPGEKFGLHNRVFITHEGNATYEAKDMGLAPLQFSEFKPDLILHVVGPEQASYFQVVFEALAQLFPDTKGKEYHLIYGWVKLKHGKMSSRTGLVVLGEWLLDVVKKEVNNILLNNDTKYNKVEQEMIAEKTAIAAVKYAFLKVSTSQEIAFDLKESVNINGDSGPYLLYAYARCRSVLKKADKQWSMESVLSIMETEPQTHNTKYKSLNTAFNPEEHYLARLIYQFPEIASDAARNYAPNVLARYLYQLAQAFNLFYQKHQILSQKSNVKSQNKLNIKTVDNDNNLGNSLSKKELLTINRLGLTAATAKILQQGLFLLGIETVERM
ncbi:arginine--tRNA ligase [Candidatus Gottesmanbacteria bacterium RBG_16_43_7]|uniref:Arginine--tRNA ligase n=1 Tax=Candidatus Gottesmanbacteria bacterium RBG_16_43_7 TaxID=1798373 RepID=A0A1F5ZC72_9BACT|nr:MAG: arginine--tRNA ligase [Candidatus Gottesmanbacteria bacterium RBG_16_43_7]